MREYDIIADWYVACRNARTGVPEVTALADRLRPGARVLDVGCGDGVPLTRLLIERGFDVYAIDSSARMIERFRARFPNVPARRERIQDTDLFRATFAAVIAWGVLFHLAADDQEAVIAKVASVLEPGGLFLFTSGPDAGTTDGEMAGVPFHYVSLGSTRYAEVLETNGLQLISEHSDPDDNYVYVAEKTPAEPWAPA